MFSCLLAKLCPIRPVLIPKKEGCIEKRRRKEKTSNPIPLVLLSSNQITRNIFSLVPLPIATGFPPSSSKPASPPPPLRPSSFILSSSSLCAMVFGFSSGASFFVPATLLPLSSFSILFSGPWSFPCSSFYFPHMVPVY